MNRIEIIQPAICDRPILIDALKTFLNPSHALLRIKGLLEWQHLGTNSDYNFLVALDSENGKPVAVQGFMPGNFLGDEEAKDEVGLVNWYASPDYPSSGYMLLRRVLNSFGFRYCFGLGSSSDAERIHRQLGYCIFEQEQLVLINSECEAFSVARIPKVVEKTIRSIKDKHQKYRIQRIEKLKELESCSQALWTGRFPHRGPLYCYRRYMKHPWYDYNFELLSTDGGDEVGVVYRVVTGLESPVVKIIDVFGNPKSFGVLSCRMSDVLLERKAEYADFYVWTNGRIKWEEFGFINVSQHAGLVIPQHLSPLVKKNIKKVGMFTRELPSYPYFVRGDTDQDRPSYNYSVDSSDD
jgi:hypothetical protein